MIFLITPLKLSFFYDKGLLNLFSFHLLKSLELSTMNKVTETLLPHLKKNKLSSMKTKILRCVWMRQFKRVIHLFGEFEILSRKMICLDEEIKIN